MATILIVDDEPQSRSLLRDLLADVGHEVALAENAAQACAYRDRARPDLVLLDVWLPDVDGITLLQEWTRREQLTMPVLMLTGYGSIESAVRATQLGAAGYLEKPIPLPKLLQALERSLAPVASGPNAHQGLAHGGHFQARTLDDSPAPRHDTASGRTEVRPGSSATRGAGGLRTKLL